MKQFNSIKAKYPGALLLFRVGDFYETFGEDAIKASQILDIVLTKRANGAASHIELAGFPYHSLDSYLPKLVRAGNRVAICDQLEDPKFAKGIVKRGVTELVTPGLSLNDHVLEKRSNNFLASIHITKDKSGVAFLDLSTGEFMCAQGGHDHIDKLIQSFDPSEIIYCKHATKLYEEHFDDSFNSFALEDWVFQYDYGYEKLTYHFGTNDLKGFGIEEIKEGIIAAGAVLHYLEETEHKKISHVSAISRIEEEKYVWLDKFTIRNLELLYPQQDGGVALLSVLDQTSTAMGARLMKKWVVLPLKQKEKIKERLKTVQSMVSQKDTSEELIRLLKQVPDIERLISKVAAGRVNPRELFHLKKALKIIAPIKRILESSDQETLKKLADQLLPCEVLLNKIETELEDDPPINPTQSGLIKPKVNATLDEYRELAFSGKDYLLQIQQREMQNTGISSLKISYNKVFGYYLEVSHTHKDKVPAGWIRKQTLTNAERYITPELKE